MFVILDDSSSEWQEEVICHLKGRVMQRHQIFTKLWNSFKSLYVLLIEYATKLKIGLKYLRLIQAHLILLNSCSTPLISKTSSSNSKISILSITKWITTYFMVVVGDAITLGD